MKAFEEDICTRRLRLRRLTGNDWKNLASMLQDEDVMYAYEHAFSEDEVTQWMERQMVRYEKEDGLGLLAVDLKEDGTFIGQCGLTYQNVNGEIVPEIGYLLKKIDADFLLQSIRHAVAGDSVISPEMTSKLVMKLRNDTYRASSASADIESLTPRERQTLAWLARGVSNKEIARTLDLAESTVKVHVQSVLRKLNIKSRVQAAVFAVEHHLDKL